MKNIIAFIVVLAFVCLLFNTTAQYSFQRVEDFIFHVGNVANTVIPFTVSVYPSVDVSYIEDYYHKYITIFNGGNLSIEKFLTIEVTYDDNSTRTFNAECVRCVGQPYLWYFCPNNINLVFRVGTAYPFVAVQLSFDSDGLQTGTIHIKNVERVYL